MLKRFVCLLALSLLPGLWTAAQASAVRISQFSLADDVAEAGWIAPGPDGNLWFTWLGHGSGTGGFGVFDTRTSRVQLIPTRSNLRGIAVAGGAVWSVMNGESLGTGDQLLRVDPATRRVETRAAGGSGRFWRGLSPSPDGSRLYTAEEDSHLGGAERFGLLTFDAATGTAGRRVALAPPANEPTVTSDGSVWIDRGAGVDTSLAHVDPVTGQAAIVQPSPAAGIYHIAPGNSGDLWVDMVRSGEDGKRTIGHVVPGQGIEERDYVLGNGASSFVTAMDGVTWYSTQGVGGLVRIDPATGAQSVAVSPTSTARGLGEGTVGPDGASLWFAAFGDRTIPPSLVKIDLDDTGPDAGDMAAVLGRGVNAIVPCGDECRGTVGVTLLSGSGSGSAKATAAAAARGVKVARRRVSGRGPRVVRMPFSARARRLVRAKGRSATLRITARVRTRKGGRARSIGRTVLLHRAGR
jgi:streptogramin lyase